MALMSTASEQGAQLQGVCTNCRSLCDATQQKILGACTYTDLHWLHAPNANLESVIGQQMDLATMRKQCTLVSGLD